MDYEAIAKSAISENLKGTLLHSLSSIQQGANGRCYKAETTKGNFFLKFHYPREDHRKGLEKVEYDAYRFLESRGVSCIPTPIFFDQKRMLTCTKWIEGQRPPPTETTVQSFLDFLERLKEISKKSLDQPLQNAAEACFSFAALSENLKTRISLLQETRAQSITHEAMSRHVEGLDEGLRKIIPPNIETFFTKPIERNWSLLSPSDLGIHNSLLASTGLVFLDFDYFGWDDPAKTIADFALHPAMNLEDSLSRLWIEGALKIFSGQNHLAERIPLMIYLYGIKWSLILLNEFRADQRKRRSFSLAGESNQVQFLENQLKKSEEMLRKAKNLYEYTAKHLA